MLEIDELLGLYGRDIIHTGLLSEKEIKGVLSLAKLMKAYRDDPTWKNIFFGKSFLMIFLNKSLRTRLSFEVAITELGGSTIYLSPDMFWLRSSDGIKEEIEDIAKVNDRYVSGTGIRAAEGEVPFYGAGHELLLEYARWSTSPVVNMANDKFHPCQGLADLMGWLEYYSESEETLDFDSLQGKNFLLSWAKGNGTRTWSSVHEALLVASRFGMNITIARPDGYDLDEEIYSEVKKSCSNNKRSFRVVNDPVSGYEGANIVYSRNWMSEQFYQDSTSNKEKEYEKSISQSNWITTEDKMKKTDSAIYTHCMPIYRGLEVEGEVVRGERSVVYNIAENRLHVQKSLISLIMGKLPCDLPLNFQNFLKRSYDF